MSTIELKDTDVPAQVANEIRKLINQGVLSPRVQLRQSELADRFGISRVPVREALNLLSATGVVVHDPNRGFFVATLSSDEARQLYRYRYLVERELFESIEWPNREQTRELKAMLKLLDGYLEDHRRAEWIDQYYAFYAFLFDLSPQKIIRREALRLIQLTDRYRALATESGRPGERLKAHLEHALLDAIATKDREQLLAVYQAEREGIMAAMIAVLAGRGL
ncbi:GntR family transcriptional regulator [Pandoraea oxalativorans]|uniref:GntR family transcriptional regulator n=1 Tax=Pandoraea oxalativorans TaxID=573737 RepID=A0A0E3U6F4_9BURK|nr:GntR family transcriptional regulator [Pandoraea oxalativorans]AKC69458.1 GntR family transcriptional regulator [Pandoraea oxalativorans]